MKKISKKIKALFTIKDTPEMIAQGFAIGSFIGMLPIPGLQVFVAYFFASVLKINKSAACIAVFNTNLITGPFIFAFNYWIGKTLLNIESSFEIPNQINLHFLSLLLDSGYNAFLSLFFGGLISGSISALISYPIIKKYVIYRQSKTN